MTEAKLEQCPDCGHDCSKLAKTCPNCGRPLTEMLSVPDSHPSDTLHNRVMTQAGTKIGVCLTLLGLIKIMESNSKIKVYSDELLAVATFGFLLSGLFVHFALKEPRVPRKLLLGKLGDWCYVASMAFLGGICMVVVIETM